LDLIFEQTQQQLEERGNISDTEIDATISLMRKWTLPTMAVTGVLGGLLFGGIIAVIITAILKKDDPEKVF
jgi:hypothetical protein